jgi:hypothetical protein
VPETPIGPSAGWYADPASDRTIRWWDGSAWTVHQAAIPKAPRTGPGTHQPHLKRIRALWLMAYLTLVCIPVNGITIAWGTAQNSAQCNAPPTWDQTALGIYFPLLFVVFSLGCLIAAIVTRIRSRNIQRPVGSGIIALSAIGLAFALGTGYFAALSVSFINWCF